MTAGRWKVLDYDREVVWLADLDSQGHTTGFDAGRWPASIWVLNTIYELRVAGGVPTYGELHRDRLQGGLVEPTVIGGVDLDARTTVTGVEIGFARRPGDPRWRRIRWSQLANQLGTSFADQRHPPCLRWFPYSSWPANLLPPAEGSLDETTMEALLPHLVRHGGPECVASYGFVPAGMDDDVDRCFSGPLMHLTDLIDETRSGTPSNVWAIDRSWMLWTDGDLWATKVNGTPTLIADLEADPDLETVTWP